MANSTTYRKMRKIIEETKALLIYYRNEAENTQTTNMRIQTEYVLRRLMQIYEVE